MEQTAKEKGKLYLVPTPIGNLEDMTFRAINVLKSSDLILAEDTRHTLKLLNHFDIQTPMESFHEHNQRLKLESIIERITHGEMIALVSDAGMPVINDPGHPLVLACIQSDIEVVALPGPNAALTALVASGLSSDRFTYYGFFPRDNKSQAEVTALVGRNRATAIFYESPHRVKKTLQAFSKQLDPDTPLVLARELTKKYEEYTRGSLSQVQKAIEDRTLKGEFVILVAGGHMKEDEADPARDSHQDLGDWVRAVMDQENLSAKEAIKVVAKRSGHKRQAVYQAYHQLDQ